MDGIHLLGEWYGCPADTPVFTQADALRDVCRKAVEEAGLTIVGDRFFQFKPQGVTGTVLLAESHLAIHTWPEAGFVAVDVYVCNYSADNSAKARKLLTNSSRRASLETPEGSRRHHLSGPGDSAVIRARLVTDDHAARFDEDRRPSRC